MGQAINARAMSVLGACNVAGMLDLVALPIWIGALIEFYGLSAAQAGITVTAFLAGVVLASLITAPVFDRIRHRQLVAAGFGVGAVAFGFLASIPVGSLPFAWLPIIHGIAGMAAGSALSITHGAIGRSGNPHRLFGLANVALAAFGIAFFAIVPGLIHSVSARILFAVFGITMAVAAAIAIVGFPAIERAEAVEQPRKPIPDTTWLIIVGVACLAFNQALIFSFVERIGDAKGFTPAEVGKVFVILGFFNLLPGALAALVQKRASAIAVGIAGPVLQATLALLVINAPSYTTFAVCSVPYVAVVIFTHTFLFGLLSRTDESGRAVAATPAMMMVGSAAGPAVGGAIVTMFGYQGLGYMAAAIAAVVVILMLVFKMRTSAIVATAEI